MKARIFLAMPASLLVRNESCPADACRAPQSFQIS
jgi:hypothetical protein